MTKLEAVGCVLARTPVVSRHREPLARSACVQARTLRLFALPLPPSPFFGVHWTHLQKAAAAMKCPYCLADNDRVLDSRASQDGFAIRRRRECLGCKRRYTTYERIEATTVKIVKKDGSREPFDHAKIKRGLEKACWKRPISDEQLEAIIAAVENELEANFESEVESRQVGELVMQHLRELDEVAYVRFASVYRQFKDVQDFVEELRPMLAEPRRDEGEEIRDKGKEVALVPTLCVGTHRLRRSASSARRGASGKRVPTRSVGTRTKRERRKRA